MTIRVLLADDEQLIRVGLRLILDAEDDIEVVGEATNGREAVELAARLAPDVVLMDVQMPEMNGLAATQEIRSKGGEQPRVVMLTTFELDEYVYESLKAGASGFLLKRTPPEELARGLRIVAAGDALLAPSVTRRLISEFLESRPSVVTPAAMDELTAREHEILLLMAEGLSNRDIADRLVLGEGTVKTHVGRVLDKLAVRDRTQAVILAYDSGLVRPGSHQSPETEP